MNKGNTMVRLNACGLGILLALAGCSEVRDTHELLNSVLWMQTSAEYNTLSQLAYTQAKDALDKALANKCWTAALEQGGDFQNLPPGVVLDLDETVLDNTPFEGRLIKSHVSFNLGKWEEWVKRGDALALPGALEFLSYAQSKGVAVFFVTNRRVSQELQTRKNLEKLGINLPADLDTVLTEGEKPEWSTDKSSRRGFLAEQYRILLLIGDDLGDFVSGAKDTPERRVELAKLHSDRWGHSWFLIPNPLYGSWEAALYPKGSSDREALQLKQAHIKSYD